jgi:hypothetical protein
MDERPSTKFLMSDGTTADFEEFFKKDPIGAAQYATGLAKAADQHFEGLEEMQKMLDAPDLDVEAKKKQLSALGARSPVLFKFVEKAEARIQSRDETLGWNTT